MVDGLTSKIQKLDPGNLLAAQYSGQTSKKATEKLKSKSKAKPTREWRPSDDPLTYPLNGESSNSQPISNLTSQEKYLTNDYLWLKQSALMLHVELSAVLSQLPPSSTVEGDHDVLPALKSMSEGKVGSVVPMSQPESVRSHARKIMASPSQASELIIQDFESVVQWSKIQNPPLSTDAIRSRLIKRKTLLEAALPESMAKNITSALRHIEREHLEKKYVNDETMISGDPISDIPKENFFVSEDNYAWDMDELVQAITAKDGVMRNPLSHQLFTSSDIQTILSHPLGARLKPLQLKQDQLKQGVRPKTIEWVAKVGKILLEDQSVDTVPSRNAMDEFLAYVATLPQKEQDTIKSLKIPGVDSTSRQPFDYSIGESVRDAVGNLTCLHKTGDFLTQAAKYLKKQ